jgi:hypothetical protein
MTDPRTWASPGSATPGTTPGHVPPVAAGPEPSDQAVSDEIEAEIPLRPLGISEILDGAVTYIRRNPRATLGMSAILTAVIQVIITLAQYFAIGSEARAELTPATLQRSLGPEFIVLAGGLLLTALVVLLLGGLLAPVMARMLLGRSTSFERLWRDVRPSLARLCGAAVTVMAIVLLAMVVPFVPLLLAVLAGAPTILAALAWTIAVPGALVLMVGGYIWFALSTPLLVMERRGVFGSLRRSAEIVRGHWWRMFGALLLTLMITLFVQFIVLPIPFAVAQQILLAVRPDPGGWALVGFVAIGMVGRIIAGTLLNPFNAGVITLLYADRRMRREAFDLELQMAPPADPLAGWLPGPLTAAGSGHQPKTFRPPLMAYPPPPPPGWRP